MLRMLSGEGWGRPWGLAPGPSSGEAQAPALFVTDERAGAIRCLGADGDVADVATGLRAPQGLALAAGRLFACEAARGRVAVVDAATGTLESAWEGLVLPSGVDAVGDEVFVASAGSHAVFARDLRCREEVRTVAGTPGSAGNMKHEACGDRGSATAARLFSPCDVVVAPSGTVYVSDSYNGRVREISGGIIRTVAGADQSAPRGNRGRATEINIGQPRGIALSPDGQLFVATQPGMVWKLIDDEMLPVAGTWVDGNNGDEGDALEMRLCTPWGVACWGSALAIADSDNRRICLVEPL